MNALETLPNGWLQALREWCEQTSEIDKMWMYGSRARGEHQEGSDLDLVVSIAGYHNNTPLGIWCSMRDEWQSELGLKISHRVDLRFPEGAPAKWVDNFQRDKVMIFERARSNHQP